MNALAFLAKLSLGHFRRHRLEALLCLIGVALGVAVVVAIDSAVTSCVSSFAGGVDALAERSTHSIFAEHGQITDQQFIALADLHLPSAMAPMIDRGVLAGGDGHRVVARLLGIDVFSERGLRSFTDMKSTLDANAFTRFLTEPGQVVVAEPLATRLGLSAGSDVQLTVGSRRVMAHVAGIAPLSPVARAQMPDLILADLATAQELEQCPGWLDRIDVKINSPRQEAMLVAALPKGLVLQSTRQQISSLSDLIGSYKLNLNSLSLMASFVAIFIVYNSMLVSVQQRSKTLGILRCLGSSRWRLVTIYLTEAMGFAVAGALVGVIGGWGLAHLLVGYVSTTVNDLYATVRPGPVPFNAMMFVKGLAVSMVSCLLGALVPLYRASRTPPINVLRASTRANASGRASVGMFVAGLLLLAGSCGIYALPGESPIAGFAMELTIALGFALLCPLVVRWVCAIVAAITRPAQLLAVQMASGGVSRSLGITAVAVAAMMLAMAMNVGVRTMTRSFRGALSDWLDHRFSADVLIGAELLINHKIDATIDPAVEKWLRRQPEVGSIVHYRVTNIEIDGKSTALLATDVTKLIDEGTFPLKSRPFSRPFDPAHDILISEPLAGRLKRRAGDTLRVNSPTGEKTFQIYAVFYDFGNERGQAMMDRGTYAADFGDAQVTSLHVRLRPGNDPAVVAARWSAELRKRFPIVCNSFGKVKNEIMTIFDRTFRVTDVLSWLSGGVAFCGLAGSLLALALTRRRDYSVLMAVGMSGRQMGAWVLAQGLLIAWTSAAVAVIAGTILAYVLSYVIQYRSFGWSIPTHPQPQFWVETFVLATAAAVVAALYPMCRLARGSPAASLRQE